MNDINNIRAKSRIRLLSTDLFIKRWSGERPVIDRMEALGAASSIIAVLQLSSEVIKYINSAVGATKERKRLRAELRACERILEDLADEADDSDEGKAWSETIKALESPGAPLGRLDTALRSIEAKLHPKGRVDKVLTSLKWPFRAAEVTEILSTIEREKSLLELALTNNTRKLIQEMKRAANENQRQLLQAVDGLNSHINNQELTQERLAILNWLSPVDYTRQQAQLISERQEGTGRWLLDSDQFTTWVQAEKQTLFCPVSLELERRSCRRL